MRGSERDRDTDTDRERERETERQRGNESESEKKRTGVQTDRQARKKEREDRDVQTGRDVSSPNHTTLSPLPQQHTKQLPRRDEGDEDGGGVAQARVWTRTRLAELCGISEGQVVEWAILMGNDYTRELSFRAIEFGSHRRRRPEKVEYCVCCISSSPCAVRKSFLCARMLSACVCVLFVAFLVFESACGYPSSYHGMTSCGSVVLLLGRQGH